MSMHAYRPHIFRLIAALTLVVLTLTGCQKDYTSRMNNVLDALHHGDTDVALEGIEALIARAEANKKPERNNLTLLLLERGTIHLANGDLAAAAADFNAADQMLEILDLTPQGARNAAAALFSGDAVVYHAPIYEKLMVNIVSVSTYLSLNNTAAAAVEARRLIVLTQYFTGAGYDAHPALSLAYSLAGYALDRVGESAAARRLYEAAIAIDGSPFATQALERLRGARGAQEPELAVLVLSGRGPVRVPQFIPIGLLLGWVNDDFPLSPSETEIIGGFSAEEALSVVRFPVLEPSPPTFAQWHATTHTGAHVTLPLASDTNAFALQQWRDARPAIAMTAISRFLTRHVTQTAMSLGADAVGGVGGGIMRIVGLATKGAMLAADTPDTRAWNTIPGSVFLGYIPAAPDTTAIHIIGSGEAGTITVPLEVDLGPGERSFVLVYSVH